MQLLDSVVYAPTQLTAVPYPVNNRERAELRGAARQRHLGVTYICALRILGCCRCVIYGSLFPVSAPAWNL